MAEHNELGRWGERKATEYLEAQGYTIWERNWHTGHRDIDIIAYKDNTLVIVEVKTRRNNVFMEPEMAVNRKKAHSIMIAANLYVKTKRSLSVEPATTTCTLTILRAHSARGCGKA